MHFFYQQNEPEKNQMYEPSALSWYEGAYGVIVHSALLHMLSQAAVIKHLILISIEVLVDI